jgi:hypothetical protein
VGPEARPFRIRWWGIHPAPSRPEFLWVRAVRARVTLARVPRARAVGAQLACSRAVLTCLVRTLVVLLAVSPLVPSSAAGGRPLYAQPPSDLAEAVHQDLIRVAAPGAVLAWIDREGVRWMEPFGSQDLEGTTPMHLRHRMHLGTFGDLLLAALAVEMEALGLLSLDVPVRTLLGGLAPGVGSRTLSSLLLHTGGFDSAPLAARPRGAEALRMRVDEAVPLLDDRVIMLPVGALRSPSPHHTLLVTQVLAARGSGSLEGAFRTYLFRPAGVVEAIFAHPGGVPAGVHPGFQVRLARGAPYAEAPFPEPAVLQLQERIWMHANDLAHLLHYWIFLRPVGSQLLTPRVPDPDAPPRTAAFSLGFRWDGTGRADWIGEGPGHTVQVRALPAQGAILLAMAPGGASPLTRGLEALEQWVEREAPPRTASNRSPNPWGELSDTLPDLRHPTPVDPSASVAGRYRNGSEVFHLRWQDGRLEADLGIGTWLPIRESDEGALEVHLEDGRTAFRFRLLYAGVGGGAENGGTFAYARGMIFVRDAR